MSHAIRLKIRMLMHEQGIWSLMENGKIYFAAEIVKSFNHLMTDELKTLLLENVAKIQSYLDERIIQLKTKEPVLISDELP